MVCAGSCGTGIAAGAGVGRGKSRNCHRKNQGQYQSQGKNSPFYKVYPFLYIIDFENYVNKKCDRAGSILASIAGPPICRCLNY